MCVGVFVCVCVCVAHDYRQNRRLQVDWTVGGQTTATQERRNFYDVELDIGVAQQRELRLFYDGELDIGVAQQTVLRLLYDVELDIGVAQQTELRLLQSDSEIGGTRNVQWGNE